MSTAAPPRALVIVVVVLAALLGTGYAVGRNLTSGGDPYAYPVPDPSAPLTAEQPSATGVPPEQPPPSPPAGWRLDGPTGGGPFGARDTTGTADVALTFDDGPDPRYTPQALTALRAYGVTATFCLVGENVQAYPDLVRAIVAEGHTLCNHSWSHDVRLGARSRHVIQADLLRTNQVIRAAVPGARIAYFRQPGGAWTYPVVSVASELGMMPLHWTVDPGDWQLPGASSIVATVTAGVGPGSIVLLHDAGGDRQGTVDSLYRILPNLTSRFRVTALPSEL
ncbi:polysaccharide deacetylase family protein [Micromonospora sp. WMMD882]|uniref:polysaccharide deacetylase family protein n=1 Tax=Micromonospora sp. WMMD882 TaxID=3015151 RepID=UPI00248B103F|nr:polysaccharide deacetylase family protein [Micromonospora sp. WMMD882]WBB78982.1 polysaccharide deacetylase family protein [Micromonospora sp. WMMD882]